MIINCSVLLSELFLGMRSREKDGAVILSELRKKSFLCLFLPPQIPSDSYFRSDKECKGGWAKTNLREQNIYICKTVDVLYTSLFHLFPYGRVSCWLWVEVSSVRLFSLYSIINRDHSSLLDEEGKSDLDSFNCPIRQL